MDGSVIAVGVRGAGHSHGHDGGGHDAAGGHDAGGGGGDGGSGGSA